MDILREIIDVTLGTVKDVLPIAAIIFGFQFAVIRKNQLIWGKSYLGLSGFLSDFHYFYLGWNGVYFPLVA